MRPSDSPFPHWSDVLHIPSIHGVDVLNLLHDSNINPINRGRFVVLAREKLLFNDKAMGETRDVKRYLKGGKRLPFYVRFRDQNNVISGAYGNIKSGGLGLFVMFTGDPDVNLRWTFVTKISYCNV
jgi:hypothetical protein